MYPAACVFSILTSKLVFMWVWPDQRWCLRTRPMTIIQSATWLITFRRSCFEPLTGHIRVSFEARHGPQNQTVANGSEAVWRKPLCGTLYTQFADCDATAALSNFLSGHQTPAWIGQLPILNGSHSRAWLKGCRREVRGRQKRPSLA